MTTQEYYDLLVVSAFDGTMPCYEMCDDYGFKCLYRHWDGQMMHACAIGIGIPDEKYMEKYDENNENGVAYSAFDIINMGAFEVPEGMTNSYCGAIQNIHDNNATDKDFISLFLNRINKLECFSSINRIGATSVHLLNYRSAKNQNCL